MDMRSRRQYLKLLQRRYLGASKEEKARSVEAGTSHRCHADRQPGTGPALPIFLWNISLSPLLFGLSVSQDW